MVARKHGANASLSDVSVLFVPLLSLTYFLGSGSRLPQGAEHLFADTNSPTALSWAVFFYKGVNMKKSTALTIGAIALLSAGLSFGVKFKQRKDYEEKLKTILIPDAEKKLDDLLREDVALRDSVIKFEEAQKMLQEKKGADAEVIDTAFLELGGIVDTLLSQWHDRPSEIFYGKFGNEIHESPSNWDVQSYLPADNPDARTDKKAIELYKEVFHRTGNKSHYYPVVPDYGEKFMLKDALVIPALYETRGILNFYYDENDTALTQDMLVFFETMIDAIGSTVEDTQGCGFNDFNTYIYNGSPKLRLTILKSLQSFINSVDNSKNVFDAKTLNLLDKKVKKLLPIIEKKVQIENKEIQTKHKLEHFKSAKESVENRVVQERKHLDVLKTTNIRELMKKEK